MNLIRFCIFTLLLLIITQPLTANNTAESPLRLVVLGDSLVAGYGLAAHESFPSQLERALERAGHDIDVINAGVSGDTTAGGLARLDWALADNPQLVLVELGANDALRGLPPEQSFANLDAILTRLVNEDISILLTGMQAPQNMGDEYVTEFNNIYQRLAEKHNVSLYPFFLKGVALDPSLNQPDGIHPNPDGVRIIVENILPYILQELNQAGPQ